VRSPPESRHHLPDATRDLHKSPATPHARHPNRTHITNKCTRRGTRTRARRSTTRC
jgi:hypothetical protein